MRVIAGVYRSRPLVAPPGLNTRPTTDRLRETLFNVLAPRISGSTFADLYAGSGANGIEAISRGAASVVFVEQGPSALGAIRTNLRTMGINTGINIEARSVAAFLRARIDSQAKQAALEIGAASFDIVFLDPPYEDGESYAATLGLLGGDGRSLLAHGAIVIAEHRHKRPLDESYSSLKRYRLLKQGDAALSFFSIATVRDRALVNSQARLDVSR